MNSIFWHDFRKAFHTHFPPHSSEFSYHISHTLLNFQARIPPFLARFSQSISKTIFVKHPISLSARHSIPLSATLVRIFVSHFTYPSQFSSTHPTFSGTIFAKNFKNHFRKASHLAFRKAFLWLWCFFVSRLL